jgi:hypothetical protein
MSVLGITVFAVRAIQRQASLTGSEWLTGKPIEDCQLAIAEQPAH